MSDSELDAPAPQGQQLKSAVGAAVAAHREALIALSNDLYAHPETAWNEVESAKKVASLLRDHGFEVTENFVDLPMALHATFGHGRRRLALMAEYDALPVIGHACGHNLISAMSVVAAIALASVADELDIMVELFGTPAEEGAAARSRCWTAVPSRASTSR